MIPNNNISHRNLSFLYQNVRGLRTKCLDLYNNILLNDYDILLFSETWLQDDILDSELCDNRYTVFRQDRNLLLTNKKTGGGVMICARRELGAELCNDWNAASTESLCITIPSHKINSTGNLHIVIVYVPPDRNEQPIYLNTIKDNMECILNSHPSDNYILIGDFNLTCLLWSNNCEYTLSSDTCLLKDAALEFVDQIYFLGLTQYNFISNSEGKYLDLCFSNLPCTISRCALPIIKEDKYHPSLNISVLDLHTLPLREKIQPYLNFYKCDYKVINDYLLSIDWSVILNAANVDDAVDLFYNILYKCFHLHIPLIKRPKRKLSPQWYSPALHKIINEKMKVHKKWKKYGNPRDYDEFCLLRSRQKRVQAQCFDNFKSNTERLIKHSPKHFWSYVKSKRGGSNYPNKFTIGNTEITDGQDICNAFNKFFESVFVPPCNSSTHCYRPPNPYTSDEIVSSVNVSEPVVLKLLSSLNKDKGAGCDGIPSIFLASCAKSLALPITLLFRRSLKECVFPTKWKQAQIVPVHKKGSKSLITNYRPISILNSISKLFEKLIFDIICPVIKRGIPDSQHGFLRGRSTVTNLALFSNFVLSEMENGGQVDVVYTDFEKAFDRVDHDILLHKLNNLGIHGDLLRWVSSYLSNRSQAVVVGGFRSNYISIPSGVPQGSHLGPLFYNAYIYDIGQVIKHSKHLLYADDKKIFLRVRSVDDCKLLQNDLYSLLDYYTANRINISIEKCQTISFTRKKNPIEFSYHFNNVQIERVYLVRDLGVYFDSKMLFSSHIDTIVTKAYRNLGFVIRTCSPFRSPLTLQVIFNAYVRSILEYASPIWSPCYSIYKDRIERIQRKFVKHMNYKCMKIAMHTSYKEKCKAYGLLSLEDRRLLLDMGLLFDIIRGRLDCSEILNFISLRTPLRRTRHTALLNIPYHSTKYGKNSVFARISKIYNSMFKDIDLFLGSKHLFKSKIIKVVSAASRGNQ